MCTAYNQKKILTKRLTTLLPFGISHRTLTVSLDDHSESGEDYCDSSYSRGGSSQTRSQIMCPRTTQKSEAISGGHPPVDLLPFLFLAICKPCLFCFLQYVNLGSRFSRKKTRRQRPKETSRLTLHFSHAQQLLHLGRSLLLISSMLWSSRLRDSSRTPLCHEPH